MIVGHSFEEDSTRIGWIQHDMYGESLRHIVTCAEKAYRHAQVVLGTETEVGKKLPVMGFDHRSVQYFHDKVAAQFRYKYIVEGDLADYALLADLAETERVQVAWQRFLRAEMPRLLHDHPVLSRLILVSALFPNPSPEGIAAENELHDYMSEIGYPYLAPSGCE